MTRFARRILLTMLISITCSAPLMVAAAEVELINGEVLDGEVLPSPPNIVKIRTLTKTVEIPKARVKAIRQSAPGSTLLQQAGEALRKDELEKATTLLQSARDTGAPAERLVELEKRISERRGAIIKARYDKLITRAKESIANGEATEAVTQVRDELANLPADSPFRQQIVTMLSDFHLRRAANFRDRVRVEMAVEELVEVSRLDPNRVQTYIDLGDLFKATIKTWPEAIRNYQMAIRLSKSGFRHNVTGAHWELGEIFRQQSKWKEASIHYRAAFLAQPTYNSKLRDRLLESFRTFATELEDGSKLTASLAVVEEGLKIYETEELLLIKGRLLGKLQRFKESNAALQAYLVRNPRARLINYQIAQNYFAMGELFNGREALMQEVAIFPGNYDALCLLGDSALQRDDLDGARSYYTKAKDISPDQPRALLGLGKAYRVGGDLAKARVSVQDVLSRLPKDREANLEMGRIFRVENNLDQAREYFTGVLALVEGADDATNPDVIRLRADALIARGEIALLTTGPGTANNDFVKATEVLPNYAQAYASIGGAYRRKFNASKRLEDLKTAEENLLKARTLDPTNPQHALELGILYARELALSDKDNEKSHITKARQNWDQYIELGGKNVPQVRGWIAELGA